MAKDTPLMTTLANVLRPTSSNGEVIPHTTALILNTKKRTTLEVSEGKRFFSKEEVVAFRWHGAKATLTSLARHLHLTDKGIRHAGGWKESGQCMTDTYLREAQLLALRV